MKRMLGGLALFAACAGAPSGPRREFTLRTGSGAQQMSLGKGGEIVGPTIALAPTQDGYRGTIDSQMVELRSDGERILGTVRERIVDLHVAVDDNGLVVRGLFGGRLGHLEASNVEIKSTLGACTYELEAVGSRYEGQRACGGGGGGMGIPMVRPASIELPPGFEGLRLDRQAMLLAILLSL